MHQDTPHASYVLHDNGIHEIIFKDSSRNAADDIFAQLDQLYSAAPSDQPLLLLADTSRGLPAIGYLMKLVHESRKRHQRQLKTRVAFLYKAASSLSLLGSILATLPLGTTSLRSFRMNDREAAMKWLLGEK